MTKAARKSIIIGTVLVALEQFSGCFALLFYTASVFEKAGATSIAPEHSTIIVGVIQLVGAYCSTFMVDRAGRKVLICFSGFAISVGMTIFGIATQLIEHGNASAIIKIIPIFALSFSVFVANVGVFTLTFVVLSEISPSNVSHHLLCFMKLNNKLFCPTGQKLYLHFLHVDVMGFQFCRFQPLQSFDLHFWTRRHNVLLRNLFGCWCNLYLILYSRDYG